MARTWIETVYYVEDESTGELFILPTETELIERQYAIQQKREQIEAQAVDSAPKRRARANTLEALAEMLAGIETLRANRDEALKLATVRKFTLTRPTYGQWCEAEGEATVVNEETGEVRIDERVFAKSLLPQCMPDLKPAEVMALDSEVYLHLWNRFRAVTRPDASRLPFWLWQYRASSTASQ